ncbi:hypothetical protein DD238_007872 [Peronospora effusa]|uniref:Uncharacterized protein n=1 Tax=Peronospora effusa TaxID=542832 RepID=A0A3M6VD28_9STRA|nr:hypothetical protein DD238_007872 [Peronospora effusa]
MTLYVVQGIAYFISHPRLWLATLCPLVLTLLVAIITVVMLFAVALYPQAKGLEEAGVVLWLSWLLGVMIVLVEIFLVTFIFNSLIMGCYEDKIFEQVMVARGCKELVENEERHAGFLRKCRSCYRVSFWMKLGLLLITLPLNLLPIIGSILYAWLNGTIVAWESHLLYFEFKNFSYGQQRAFVNNHKVQYSSFGMQALLMEMIPGVGLLSVFTNAVGAALFAAQLEEEEKERMQMQQGELEQYYNITYIDSYFSIYQRIMSTYVAQGLAYFLAHPSLWRLTLCPILLTIVVGMTTMIVLFAAAMHPQEQGLYNAGVSEGLSWALAVMLCLVESFVIVMLFSLICLACYQDKVFEFVMRQQGHEQLMNSKRTHASCLRLCSSCCRISVLFRLGLLVVTMPLNVVPVVGNAMYAWLNGTIVAWEYHFFYFELKNYSFKQQQALINERSLQYSLFGMQALLLEMIPGIGAVCMFTNTAGAALFASNIEKEDTAKNSQQADSYHSLVMSTYPLRGVLYFLRDKHLWRLTICPVLLTIVVAIGVAITLFTFTLHWQEETLYDFGLSSFFAWLIAVSFVIIEVFIVTVIYGLVALEWFKDKIFAYVLIQRGYRELVENEERHSPFFRVITSCCRVSVLLRLGLLILTLPLNMVPVLGNVMYAWLNGTLLAWESHLYYFEMKAFDFDQQKEIIAKRKFQYSAFGMQAVLLEMIPVAGAFFMFTNAAGAALFAASIEKDIEMHGRQKKSYGLGNDHVVKKSQEKTKKSREKTQKMDTAPLVNKGSSYVPPYGSN